MTSNNKILTVSYGTFSCTLEGFDDSFGTMKAIAEYFRDLAADDRYFGAEPPQPDAEMLARIAQNEISRRVQAHQRDGRIVLSAMDDSDTGRAVATRTEAEAPATEAAPNAEPAEAEADEPAATAAEEAAPVVESAEDVPAEIVTDAVPADTAADEETLEEAVHHVVEDSSDIVPGQPDAEIEAFFEGAHTTETGPQEPDVIAQSVTEDVADAIADATVDNSDDTPIAETVEEVSGSETPVSEAREATSPAPDSIAAKLQRIRAVVAQHEDNKQDDYIEDEDAAKTATAPSSAILSDDEDQALPDMAVTASGDIDAAPEGAAQSDSTDGEAEDADEDLGAMLSHLGMQDADQAEADSDSLIADIGAEKEDADDNLFEDQTQDADAEARSGDVEEAEETAADQDPAPKVTTSFGLSLEVQEGATEGPTGPRARVIKVKRADLEAAIARGDLEEYEDEVAGDAPLSLDDLAPALTPESSLSQQDEDELARELAALEAEMDMGEDDASAEAEKDDKTAHNADPSDEAAAGQIAQERNAKEVEAEDKAAPEETAKDNAEQSTADTSRNRRARLPEMQADETEDMDRLLAETDQQMDEPESTVRRDAFSHLRAAVAAKKADQALGGDRDTVKDDGAYRDDLADAVRPRRPVSADARTQRPGVSRPAPLKLVAEQRIDVTRPDGPVRPRRVAAAKEAPMSEEGESFAEFVNHMGANSLPQLVEAAAAYMSFVEERAQFSRPQLMTKVRQQVGTERFSREDSLRCFGKLLRSGKIEKIKAGRFTASEDIGFRPDRRAAS